MDKQIFKYIKDNGYKTNSKDEDANYQFMPGGVDYPWTIKVPKDRIPEFHQKYYEYKVKPGYRCHLLEKPMKDQNILKIDIDLRYIPTHTDLIDEKLKHKYTKDVIKDFIRIYMEKVNEYLEIPETAKITIMEKRHPRFVSDEKKYIKDGIHIMCPEIIAPNPVLLAIYNDFIQDENAKEVFEQFNNSEPIDKAVDSRVIFTNSWYLLGSGKPTDILDYYKPTKTYSLSFVETRKGDMDVKLKPVKLEMSEMELINYFSNYGKDECNNLKEIVNVEQLQDELRLGNGKPSKITKLTDYEKSKFIQNIPEVHRNKAQIDPAYIFGLLNCLKKSRVEIYEQWLNIACCLYNISPKNFPLFVTWSKKGGEKFSEDGCFMLWYETLPNYAGKYKSLNFDMLKYYANQDNEQEYMNLFKNKKSEFFDNMISNLIKTKFDKATKDVKFVQYVKKYITLHCPFSLKCADITKNVWYIFRNNRWVKDEGANQVYKLFTRDFLQNFRHRYNEYEEISQRARARIQNRQINSIQTNTILSPDMEAFMQDTDTYQTSSRPNFEDQIRNDMFSDDETLIETIQKSQNSITSLCDFINKPANRNNIIKDLCHECYDEEFYKNLDNNTDIFICANVVLDLKQCVIRQGQASDMNSICSNINFPMDVNTELAEECFDELEEFFDKLFPDLDVRDYALNYFAEALSGEHRREEFCIHTGTGRNGKSVLGNILKIVFGDYYYEPDASIYSSYNADPNAPAPIIANIKGKRIVMTQEIKNTKSLETAVIKKMCGGDTLTARHLNKDPIQFNPQCKFNMSCNDIPDLDSNDDAIFRRIIVIPYISTFVDVNDTRLDNPKRFPHHYIRDTSINPEKLSKWAPYFLYLLWQRYIDLHRENFSQLSSTNRPDAVRQATEEYKKQSNLFSNFMQDYIDFDPNKKQSFKDIYSEFKTYATSIDGQFKTSRQTEKNLHREIQKRGGEKKRENGEWFYYYIILNGNGLPI